MCYLAFFLIVLHISAYSISCLFSPNSTSARRFVISARVGDDIIYPRIQWLVGCLRYSLRALLDHVCDGFAHGVDVV